MPFRLVGNVDGRPLLLRLKPGPNVLGSAAECDARLRHPTVSRRHAEMVVEGRAVRITDLGSRNGTFLRSARIDEARKEAREGDTLSFGRVSLLLLWVEGDESRPAAAADAGAAPAAAGTSALEAFSLEHYPALIRRLIEGADAASLAQAAGSALFGALPVADVEVTARAGEGVLFRARRASPVPSDASWVVAGDDALSIAAAFADEPAARAFRPVVEALGLLVRLAAGREAPRTAPSAAAPPLPEPGSVVPEVQQLFGEAALVARGDVGVLVCGESGTGKEVLARYLHAASPRSGGPFVALHCGAVAREALEGEIFGIEGEGAPPEGRPGRLELAHGGTLFLDEVTELTLETQARVLRALQTRQACRLGGTSPRPADVRVVSTTNRDLVRLRAEGRFREDLYDGIATWVAEVPPLRRRRADIPNLASHFLAREAAGRGISVAGLSRTAVQKLTAYGWPGNVRQLENEMKRAALLLADGDVLDANRLSPSLRRAASSSRGSLASIVRDVEKRAIEQTLSVHRSDVGSAARALGVSRSTLQRRMKALGVSPPGD